MNRLSNEPVHHCRDAKLSHPSPARLRYLYLPYGLRFIPVFEQFQFDALPVARKVGLQFVNGHPVNACTPSILLHALVGRCHVPALDHHFHQSLTLLTLVSSTCPDA